MKKIIIMSLILVIAICMMGSSYAALSCNVSVQANKTEVAKNGEFTINVSVSNIQSDRGLIGMNATLDYDRNSLELITMEGKNGWETPENGTSYNSANGKLVLTRSGLGKNAETIFTATFKVKENSKQNLSVGLKDIRVADGTQPANVAPAYQSITVVGGTQNPVPVVPDSGASSGNPTQGSTSGSTAGSTTSIGSTNKTTSSTSKVAKTTGSLPKAGENSSMMLIAFIGLLGVVAIVLVLKIRLVNKKMGL